MPASIYSMRGHRVRHEPTIRKSSGLVSHGLDGNTHDLPWWVGRKGCLGMAGPPKQATRDSQEIEVRSDGWERFEKAVDAAVKSGPKHRPSKDQLTDSAVKAKKGGGQIRPGRRPAKKKV
jgi:hypothetical protein